MQNPQTLIDKSCNIGLLVSSTCVRCLQGQLRHEAIEIVERFKGRNRYALLNLVSDGITASSGFVLLLRDTEGRNILFRTIGRIFSGLSDTAKAFLIIAATDILLGYHSEEGWTAAIHLITNHYGQEVEVSWFFDLSAVVLQCQRSTLFIVVNMFYNGMVSCQCMVACSACEVPQSSCSSASLAAALAWGIILGVCTGFAVCVV